MSPSDMVEDDTLHISRAQAIENRLDEVLNDNLTTRQLLRDVLAKLNPETPLTALPQRPVTTSVPPPSRSTNSLKPAFPPDFSGDRNSGKAFLTSCRTYIRLCPASFEDEETKIEIGRAHV